MKKKTILSFAVALTLGLGVAVGLHANEAKGVEAAGTTVYCKNTQSWWKADGAAVGAYCWNSKNDSQKNANWPGVRMTAVSGETDLWTYTVPEAYDKIIFTRVNSSGTISDWGAKTADLTVPTDGKNMYEITSTSAVWGDPGVSGEWKTYPPEPDPTTHEYKYSLNGAAGVLMTEGSTNEVVSEVLSFKAGDKVTFTKDDAAYAVNPKDADTYTKVEKVENELVFVQDYEGALYLNVSDAVLWAGELDRGYYLTGTFNEWTNYKHAIKASAHPEEEGTYVISDLKVKENDEVQFINFVANQKDPEWKGVDETKLTIGGGVFAEKSGNNIKFTADGTIDLYFNSTNGWYSVVDSEYVPDVPEEDGYYLVGDYTHWKFTDAVKLGAGDEQNYAILENYTVTKDQKYKVESYFDGAKEWWGIKGEESAELDYVADATKAVTFYASKDGYLYVADYISSYTLTIGGKDVELTPAEGNEYSAKGVALKAGDKVTGLKAGTTAVEGYASKKVGNNNLLEDLTVIANATADIYYDKNTKELFISGLPNGGYHIITGSGDIIQMTHAEDFDGYIQYKSEMISFAKDEVIKFVDTDGEYGVRYATVFTVGIVNPDGLGKNFEATEAGIVCKTACDAKVYLKLKSGLDEIYFGEVEEYIQQAKDFADNFKTMMAQACSAENKKESVTAKWAQAAVAYKALTKEAKDELYLGGYSSVAEVREFAERYLAIASQHADWGLENFLEWEIPVSSAIYSNIEFSEENNSLMIMIVVISAATIAGASVLLILKKKRHSK